MQHLDHTFVELDKVDYQIISLLMEDAKIPYTEIAKQINVSGGTVHVRMKRLEKLGVVTGSKLEVDLSKLGYDLIAFIGIYLDGHASYKEIISSLGKVDEIVEVNYITGTYGILAKIVCRNTTHLRDILNQKVLNIPGIKSTETMISLEEGIKRPLKITFND